MSCMVHTKQGYIVNDPCTVRAKQNFDCPTKVKLACDDGGMKMISGWEGLAPLLLYYNNVLFRGRAA